MNQVNSPSNIILITHNSMTGNLFTPWFKLIARDFLFGWWDELYKRKDSADKINALSLAGLVDGSKVVKMV
jgi:isopentenyl-diphosphate delta-isomerase